MRLPCDGVVTQGFSTSHPAVDMAFNGGGEASYGKPIYAPEAGTVTYVGQMGSGTSNAGTVVQISCPGSRVHRLCHLIADSPTVAAGTKVAEGQLVGRMGWTGYVIPANIDGTHVHWVMEIDGKRVDGRDYVTNEGGANMQPITPAEVDNLLGLMWGVQTDPKGEGYNATDRGNDHKNLDGKPFYEVFSTIYQDPRTFEYADRVYKALHAPPSSDDFEPYQLPELFVKKK